MFEFLEMNVKDEGPSQWIPLRYINSVLDAFKDFVQSYPTTGKIWEWFLDTIRIRIESINDVEIQNVDSKEVFMLIDFFKNYLIKDYQKDIEI